MHKRTESEAATPLTSNTPGPLRCDLGVLVCPLCHAALILDGTDVVCSGMHRYPLVDGVPILIVESRSLFKCSDFTARSATFFQTESLTRRLVFRLMPSMSTNRVAQKNYRRIAEMLTTPLVAGRKPPRVLVLGGSILGAGMGEFHGRTDIEFIDTDVSLGPLTQVVCDGHDIPLADASVDLVVLQAVLEHVVDPFRVVREVCRVLKTDGIVYAETPFMQPAHATPYDFQRFTFIGYRRLFAQFSKIAMGPVGGPAQAIGHLYEFAALCLSSSRVGRAALYVFVRWTGFWLKYLDRLLNRSPHALYAAFGLYFIGRLQPVPLTDREVIEECRHL